MTQKVNPSLPIEATEIRHPLSKKGKILCALGVITSLGSFAAAGLFFPSLSYASLAFNAGALFGLGLTALGYFRCRDELILIDGVPFTPQMLEAPLRAVYPSGADEARVKLGNHVCIFSSEALRVIREKVEKAVWGSNHIRMLMLELDESLQVKDLFQYKVDDVLQESKFKSLFDLLQTPFANLVKSQTLDPWHNLRKIADPLQEAYPHLNLEKFAGTIQKKIDSTFTHPADLYYFLAQKEERPLLDLFHHRQEKTSKIGKLLKYKINNETFSPSEEFLNYSLLKLFTYFATKNKARLTDAWKYDQFLKKYADFIPHEPEALDQLEQEVGALFDDEIGTQSKLKFFNEYFNPKECSLLFYTLNTKPEKQVTKIARLTIRDALPDYERSRFHAAALYGEFDSSHYSEG